MDSNPPPKRRNIIGSFIPIDIIAQILLLLPARYLITLKSVCKLWFHLISDPYFTSQHTQLALRSIPRPVLATSQPFRPGDRRDLYFSDVLSETSKKMAIGKYLKKAGDVPDLDYDIQFSSSYGLLIMYSMYGISVFNPLTKEITRLPSISPGIDMVTDRVGMCVSSVTGKYTVVIFRLGSDWKIVGCNVLELGSSFWNDAIFGEFPDVVIGEEEVIPLNGVLYWRTVGRTSFDSSEEILSFDINYGPTGFGFFRTPPVPFYFCLDNIQGRLCVVHCGVDLVTDVWMLEEEGESVWIKWYSFNLPMSWLPGLTPVSIVAIYEGCVWLVRSGELFRYDPESEELAQIDTTVIMRQKKMDYPKSDYTMGFYFIETLASTRFRVDFGLCFSTFNILAAVPASQKEGFSGFSKKGRDLEILAM